MSVNPNELSIKINENSKMKKFFFDNVFYIPLCLC